jgi:hypothetical protein
MDEGGRYPTVEVLSIDAGSNLSYDRKGGTNDRRSQKASKGANTTTANGKGSDGAGQPKHPDAQAGQRKGAGKRGANSGGTVKGGGPNGRETKA